MTLLRFEFEDLRRPWHLEPVEFEPFNLLVGVSGAGKTRILNALQAVAGVALGAERETVSAARWSLCAQTTRGKMTWEATTQLHTSDPMLRGATSSVRTGPQLVGRDGPGEFESESIRDEQGVIVAERRPDGSAFIEGKELPRLKRFESLVSILRNEPAIQSLFQTLGMIRPSQDDLIVGLRTYQAEQNLRTRERSLDELRHDTTLPLVVKAFHLKQSDPERFASVLNKLQDIFPTVEDMDASLLSDLGSEGAPWWSAASQAVTLAIREAGVDGWIIAPEMSSGMQRVCAHLFELEFTPAGSIILIDEYENSLGINCLGAMTDALLERHDVQFILTSHHPWVINNIPRENCKTVQRDGARVKVLNASDIPRLNTRSAQDPFILLINAPEYLESVR